MAVKLNAVVLAGGESRRMGEDKAQISLSGQTQLERVCALADDVCDNVFVSVRNFESADALRKRFPLLQDVEDAAGPLAGILAALLHDPTSDWLVLACDLPLLDNATLSALASAAKADRESAAIAIGSEQQTGLPEPLCAVWRANMIELIRARLANDQLCARKCLILSGARIIAPVTAGALDNMNTPEDRLRLQRAVEAI